MLILPVLDGFLAGKLGSLMKFSTLRRFSCVNTDEGNPLSGLSPSMLKGSGTSSALPGIAGVFPAVVSPTIAVPGVLDISVVELILII